MRKTVRVLLLSLADSPKGRWELWLAVRDSWAWSGSYLAFRRTLQACVSLGYVREEWWDGIQPLPPESNICVRHITLKGTVALNDPNRMRG